MKVRMHSCGDMMTPLRARKSEMTEFMMSSESTRVPSQSKKIA